MTRKKKLEPSVPVSLRMPKSIKKLIDEIAEEHRRPLTTEIIIALEEYLAKHGKFHFDTGEE